MRGPINNISLGAEVLSNSLDKDSENYNVLKSIKDSCLFLSDSLDGFLNVNTTSVYRIDDIKLKYEPFNIVGLVKKMQYILLFNMMNKKIEIKYNIGTIIEWVIGDYKHIQHVLFNLLSNSIKHADEKSFVTVQMECIGMVNKKQSIVIQIIDNNRHIDSGTKSNLFEVPSHGKVISL